MPSWKPSEPEKLLIIGSSTGGPGHLQKIIKSLPNDFVAAVVIAQHIENKYIPGFVGQLQRLSRINVEQVGDRLALTGGQVFVCSHHCTIDTHGKPPLFIVREQGGGRYNPEIDSLLLSAAPLARRMSVLVLILTGIGNDGAEGCKVISKHGARCIAESESSAIVYGMPL